LACPAPRSASRGREATGRVQSRVDAPQPGTRRDVTTPGYAAPVAELVACVRCGAEGISLPATPDAALTCSACHASQPARDYLPMARLKRASTTSSKLYRVDVAIPDDLRHKVDDEKRARRRLIVALLVAIPIVSGAAVAVALL
jgi:hypothetical protein